MREKLEEKEGERKTHCKCCLGNNSHQWTVRVLVTLLIVSSTCCYETPFSSRLRTTSHTCNPLFSTGDYPHLPGAPRSWKQCSGIRIFKIASEIAWPDRIFAEKIELYHLDVRVPFYFQTWRRYDVCIYIFFLLLKNRSSLVLQQLLHISYFASSCPD